MPAKEELVSITKTYDLIAYLIPLVQKFPKHYRFSLGVRAVLWEAPWQCGRAQGGDPLLVKGALNP